MRWHAALIARLSRPVTAQRARLYLRCFFTGTGQAALSSDRRLSRARRVQQATARQMARSCRIRRHGAEGLLQPRPFAVAGKLFLGPEAAGTEIENLRVAGIEAKRARRLGLPARGQSPDKSSRLMSPWAKRCSFWNAWCWSRSGRCRGRRRQARAAADTGSRRAIRDGSRPDCPNPSRSRHSPRRDKARPARRNRPAH